jgi:hypothetical protein
MAALFALGVMSITWMAFVAAAVPLFLGVLILTSPHAIPWLTLPDEQPIPMMTPDAP